MKVYLSRDEYNNNVTPTYTRDDEFALDDDVTLTFSEPNYGQLIIHGDSFKVMAILQDIALEKSKHQFWEEGARLGNEDVIWRLTRNVSVVFDVSAQTYLAACKFTSDDNIYQTICRIASRALREGKSSVSKDYIVESYGEKLLSGRFGA